MVAAGEAVDPVLDVANRLAHLLGVLSAGLLVDELDDLAERVLDLPLVLGYLLTGLVADLVGDLPAPGDDVIGVHFPEA
jgi:hypothetical protein